MNNGDGDWISERGRYRLAWTLILASPFVASIMSAAALKLSGLDFVPNALEASSFFALATSPFAAIGPAVGSLLLRLPLGHRVALGMTFGLAGMILYWRRAASS